MRIQKSPSASATRAWSAVVAMSTTAFALVAAEFMPVSLLTPIATDLGVSEGAAGQAISVAAAFALATSLVITALAGSMDRKRILLSLAGLMIASGIVVAVSTSYTTFMAGRVLIGIAIGGFWSMSAATAMRLVSPDRVPRALAIVNGGNALATVVAAPLGSALGEVIGWRGAFASIVPIAVIAWIWLFVCLPAMKVEKGQRGAANPFLLMKRRPIALGMLAVSLFFMGQFSMFTYLRPFLESAVKVNSATLSTMLFVIGISGLVGTFVIGRPLRAAMYPTLAAIPVVMAVIVFALLATTQSPMLIGLLLGAWGLVATAAPVGWWTWVSVSLAKDAEAGGGLMVAVVQFAIALGAVLGGVLFDVMGYHATFALSIGLLLLSAGMTGLAWRATVTVSDEPASALPR